MFLLGFGLFGSFTMLPLYVQNMLHYTATWAGLVISPGGIASLFAMGLVGALIGKVDTRLLVLVGAAFNIAAVWLLQSVDLNVGFAYLTFSRLLQGFGLGFLFVPISTAAFSHLPPEQIGNATGLFNLFRNEGGSVGIAMSATVLARHAQMHQAQLADHVTGFSPIVQGRLSAAAHGLFPVAGVDPTTARELSLRLLYGQLEQQAVVKAYVDVFWMLTLAFVLFIPFILMLSGETGKAPTSAH
jgi:DHA2 family multidrug resistance protein